MDKLWAPWRISYLRDKTLPYKDWGGLSLRDKKEKGCIFCKSLKTKAKFYIIFQSRYCFAMLNIYPYNNGHILVSPKRHVQKLSQLKEVEALDLIRSLNRTQKLLDKVLSPQGYNIGINLAENSGAGITGHLHVHIVPRWKGDTNFMPVLANTKVISQGLDELYRQLILQLPRLKEDNTLKY